MVERERERERERETEIDQALLLIIIKYARCLFKGLHRKGSILSDYSLRQDEINFQLNCKNKGGRMGG
jgi:hypothetical protein